MVSRAAALREVVGDAGVFVDPLDIADIRRGLERVLTDSDLRRTLIAAGRLRAALFRWEDVARKVADALGVSCPQHASAAISQS
jgi:glycosyltransferase involved in cell wall biosynthesis